MTDIERMVMLQKEFKHLNNNSGLYAVSSDEIHMGLDFLLDNFNKEDVRVTYHTPEYPHQFNATHKGVKFMALADIKKLEKYKVVK